MLEQQRARFQQAFDAHSAGRMADAEAGYRAVLAEAPDHHQAHHYLGLVLAAREQFETAHRHLQLAVEGDGDDVQYLYNLGLVLRRLGRAADATEVFGKAADVQPQNTGLLQQLAAAAMDAKQFERAAAIWQQLCDLEPNNVEYWSALGLAHRYRGRIDLARASLGRALSLNRKQPNALLAAAELAAEQGEYNESEQLFQRCLAAAPQWTSALLRFVEFQLHTNDTLSASATLQRLNRLAADDPSVLLLRVKLALSMHDLDTAQACLDDLAGRSLDEPAHVIELLQIKVERARGDTQALDHCEQLLETIPELAEAHLLRALILTDRGRFDQADLAYQLAVKHDPGLTQTYPLRTRIRRISENDSLVDEIEHRLESSDLAHRQRGDLLFALGKACDDFGDYQRAFDCYLQANQLRHKRFDREAHSRWIDSIIDSFTELPRGLGSDSTQPIFIVGMPRSGTSLLQQCLSRHPEVAAAGELDAINRLAGTHFPKSISDLNETQIVEAAASYLNELQANGRKAGGRICDKMPMNFLFVGLISMLFPKASIIHCVRNPAATCLSNFFQDFEFGNEYSYQLEDLASYYRDYQRLMTHWGQLEGVSMMEMSYEALVSRQEETLRGLATYLDIDWDDALLDHTEGEAGVAQTASTWQVRQPMYARSIDHWKRYRQWLGPIDITEFPSSRTE